MGNGSLIYKMIIDLWLVSMPAWSRSVIALFSHPIRTVWEHRNSKTFDKFWSVVEIGVEYQMSFVVVKCILRHVQDLEKVG